MIEEDFDFTDFMDEVDTLQCGEGGCNACDIAFHRSCDPIVVGPSRVLGDASWDADTEPNAPLLLDQPDIDPYSTVGDDWSIQYHYSQGGEGG
jgi:hypothetical protein